VHDHDPAVRDPAVRDSAVRVDPEHELVGARDSDPTRSALRVLPSGVCGPYLIGSARNPLRGSSPRASRLYSAANTVTVSPISLPGSLTAGTSHAIRKRYLSAA